MASGSYGGPIATLTVPQLRARCTYVTSSQLMLVRRVGSYGVVWRRMASLSTRRCGPNYGLFIPIDKRKVPDTIEGMAIAVAIPSAIVRP